jgi:lysophospholipase L1-like esterase
MAGLLGSDFPEWQITNLAVSGFETGDALQKLEPLSIGGFDLAIVQIGANDIFHLKNLDESKDNLRALLESAQVRADQVIYITSGSIGYPPLFPALLDWFYTTRSKKFIPEFLGIADSLNIPTINNYRPRDIDIFESDPNKYYAADKFHLSDAGYKIWHKRLLEKLQEMDVIK